MRRRNHARPVGLLSLLSLLLLGLAQLVQARIPEPDHVLYGTVTVFGAPVADGTPITLVLAGQSEPLVTYNLGDDPTLEGVYALRIPMDSVDPRAPNTARPGENAQIFVAGELAASTTVGEEGTARRLDLDPGNLTGFPNLTLDDITVVEGNGNVLSSASVPVRLSTTVSATVTVDWQTADGSAVAGACPGGDYIAGSGQLMIPAGELEGTISVDVCGDNDVEGNELFTVNVTSASSANIADGTADVTIIGDDDLPLLSVDDITVIEPTSNGIATADFTVSLSRVAAQEVRVSYLTLQRTATAGEDYVTAADILIIPAGNPTGTISVPLLADGFVEPDEQFDLELTLPTNAILVDGVASATIIDPAFNPSVDPVDTLTQGQNGVDGLSGAAGVLVSPDGNDVYVAGRATDTVGAFGRSADTGGLVFSTAYNTGSSGFTQALLDGVSDLATTPDGALVFASATNDNAVSVLSRNAGGVLSLATTTDDLGPIPGLDGVGALAASSDGASFYAVGRNAGAINAFNVGSGPNPLGFIQSRNDGGLAGASDVVISPDGESVYVSASLDNLVALFSRNTVDSGGGVGQLTFVENYRDNVGGITGLAGASAMAISPDGRHLYVAGATNNNLVIFSRAEDGVLTLQETLTGGSGALFSMLGPNAVAISADGQLVAVLGLDDNSLTLFKRQANAEQANFGQLVLAEILRDGDGAITNLRGPVDVKFSPDDRHIYVTSSVDNSIQVFRRVFDDLIIERSFEVPPAATQ
ncbi:MAG: beta-propeller fold lactonase family protein [Pseudomonadota bacterium]